MPFSFRITTRSKKSKARTGILKTPHGDILTPAFIPVATLGVVKGGVGEEDVVQAKTQCQITNTFHFLDLDAVTTVEKACGLHKFFGHNHPIFTDSGGFQVFSLGKGTEFGIGKVASIFPGEKSVLKKQKKGFVSISEEGVSFRSPRDGRMINLTPEVSAKTQIALGADFIYLLDICGAIVDDHAAALHELERTERWYKRFLSVKIPNNQKTFSIIQGGLFKDLRILATDAVNRLPTFGIAIGGALGSSTREMWNIISWINTRIDWERPHHLLGVGDIASVEPMVKLGIDLFDCALPTRIARHGTALSPRGPIDVKNAKWKNAFRPIYEGCECRTCLAHTLAELHFLARGREMLAGKLISTHNLFFMEEYVRNLREGIEEGKY